MNPSDPKTYQNIAFWAWNERMEDDEIIRQIKLFHAQGFQGFFMHARAGLQASYLGKDWFRAAKTAIDTARTLGMTVWIYDEDGWPSGFAGGRVNALGEAYQIKYLKMTHEPHDVSNPSRIVAHYEKTDEGYHLTDQQGDMTIYYNVDPYYVDLLNPKVTEAFIASTHEVYKNHFKDDFGTVIKAVFTDEPQVHGAGFAWSDALPEVFYALHGYNLKDQLYRLFSDEEHRFKLDYIKAINHAFHQHYVKPLSRWCEDNGLALTGHFSAEDGLVHQSLHNGGVMPMYPSFQIPAIDYLGKRLTSPVLLKQVSSIKNQFALPYVLSETFGCAGWDVSFAELAWIWGYQAARGVNIATLHGTMYSIKGIRKRDYPAFYSYQEPWIDHVKDIFDWMANLNRQLSNGRIINRVGVLHPMMGVNAEQFFSPKQRHISNQFRVLVEALESAQIDFDLIDETLLATQGSVSDQKISFGHQAYEILIVAETTSIEPKTVQLIQDMHQAGGTVIFVNAYPTKVAGAHDPSLTKDLNTKNIPVLANREALWEKWFESLNYERVVAFKDKSGYRMAHGLVVSVVHREHEDVLYVLNTSTVDTKTTYGTYHRPASIYRINLIDGSERDVDCRVVHGQTLFELELLPMASTILVFRKTKPNSTAKHAWIENQRQRVSEMVLRLNDGNALTIDQCSYTIDGIPTKANQPTIKAVDDIYEMANRLRKDIAVTLRYVFEVKDIPRDMAMHGETEDVKSIRVNNQLVGRDVGWFVDKGIRTYDISQLITEGTNTIDFDLIIPWDQKTVDVEEIFETERNRFYRPIDIESIYLTGDFDVTYDGHIEDRHNHYRLSEGTYRIERPTPKQPLEDLTKQNLWFYRGSVDNTFDVSYDKDEQIHLKIENPSNPITVILINDRVVGTLWAPPYQVNLTPFLSKGSNEVTLRVFSSNRNLLGPHHHYRGEPLFVGVNTFKGTRGFEDFVNPDAKEVTWDHGDHVVKFALGVVWIKRFHRTTKHVGE
ncbi:MAG: hypothetical protein K9K93_00480 [Acholeplasmataceae bacterium]|nr:hypothetical protein [Acholeplasmataceae bacterium]